jgi:hypothetical protein
MKFSALNRFRSPILSIAAIFAFVSGAESEESTFEPSHLFTFEPTVFTFVPAPTPRKKRVVIAAVALLAVFGIYAGSYLIFRAKHVEVWDRDGKPYVIFPEGKMAAYYAYRPLTYIDAKCTGMGFHIGPHAVED